MRPVISRRIGGASAKHPLELTTEHKPFHHAFALKFPTSLIHHRQNPRVLLPNLPRNPVSSSPPRSCNSIRASATPPATFPPIPSPSLIFPLPPISISSLPSQDLVNLRVITFHPAPETRDESLHHHPFPPPRGSRPDCRTLGRSPPHPDPSERFEKQTASAPPNRRLLTMFQPSAPIQITGLDICSNGRTSVLAAGSHRSSHVFLPLADILASETPSRAPSPFPSRAAIVKVYRTRVS